MSDVDYYNELYDKLQESIKLTQRVGEILQEVAGDTLKPKYVVELRTIFARNKELMDV